MGGKVGKESEEFKERVRRALEMIRFFDARHEVPRSRIGPMGLMGLMSPTYRSNVSYKSHPAAGRGVFSHADTPTRPLSPRQPHVRL